MAIVTGVNEIVRNFGRADGLISKGVERGLVKAGLKLQRASQLLVPVDTGGLKGSAFTRKEGEGFRAEVSVGYTASYAVFVHENLEANHPIGQAKFLEQPARDMRQELLETVWGEARLR